VGVIAPATIECPDIEARWPLRDARKRHHGAALWVMTFYCVDRKKGGRRKKSPAQRIVYA
jgi:hypothetical protein